PSPSMSRPSPSVSMPSSSASRPAAGLPSSGFSRGSSGTSRPSSTPSFSSPRSSSPSSRTPSSNPSASRPSAPSAPRSGFGGDYPRVSTGGDVRPSPGAGIPRYQTPSRNNARDNAMRYPEPGRSGRTTTR